MFIYLILLFTVLPALELTLLIKVGSHIGVFNTLSIVVLTGVAGAYLARIQGVAAFSKIQSNLNKGNLPSDAMTDGLMIFAGGIVLLTPGLITDSIGFLLLIPWTRALLKTWVSRKFKDMVDRGQVVTVKKFGGGDFIDV